MCRRRNEAVPPEGISGRRVLGFSRNGMNRLLE
jgi:hypothetical protein